MKPNRGALTLYTGGKSHEMNVFDAGGGNPLHPGYRYWNALRTAAEFAASFMRRDLRALFGPDREEVIERHRPAEFMGFALMEAMKRYDSGEIWMEEVAA
jgi:hypothetical protein